jgi:beta-galactosidase
MDGSGILSLLNQNGKMDMSKFIASDGQFWLDDQPVLIQAGEFHYFRTPQDQWRHRLALLQAAGFNALATYIPWLWHQVEEDSLDLDGHSHPMRDLAGFLDLAAEMGLFIIPRPGPYIMAETINEGIPQWVFDNYPQVVVISQDQKTQNIASYLHPDFQACVRKWYQAVFTVLTPRQVTRGGKIILVQLDNEMGMIHWVRNLMDTNPDTLARFATYLYETYGKGLPDHYPTSGMVDFLREGIQNPTHLASGKIVEDYRKFFREYICEYTRFLWSEARSNGLEVSPVINIHGFANGGKTFPIGLSQLKTTMQMDGMISATDVYPLHIGEGNFHQLVLVNEMTKALHNPLQALFSIEFQAGGNHDFSNGQSSLYDLHTRLCISSGMRAINHYLFCDGENDPLLSPIKRHDWGHPVRKDGTLRNHYYRYPQLSKVLAAYGSDLVTSHPQTVTTIGFLLNYYLTEVNNVFTQPATEILTHQREVVLFDLLARGLALTHRPFNALELSRSDLDHLKTTSCWVMMEKECPAEVQQKLVNYIHQGGSLILAGRMCEVDFDCHPCTILRDALGVEQVRSDPPFTPRLISLFNIQDVPVSFVETYHGDFDEILATDENNDIVGFLKEVGKGKVLVLGAAMPINTLDELKILNQLALKIDCQPLFQTSNWVDIRLSRGNNGNFLFINNYQDDPVETTIQYEGKTLLGGNPVCLPARSGCILPLDWWLNPAVLIHYMTSEIVEITDNGSELVIKTAHSEFTGEMSLRAYQLEGSFLLEQSTERQRVSFHGRSGKMVLKRM